MGPDPKHVAYLDMLRELQRQRGERRRAAQQCGGTDDRRTEREREQADEPSADMEQPRLPITDKRP